MRPLLILAFASSLLAAPFEIVRPIISDVEGGAAVPSSFEHRPGETLFFSCRVAGYQKTPEEKIHLAYTIQAFDPKGVPLDVLFKNDLVDEVTPQDKEWMPKIQTEVIIPPLVPSGAYKIQVTAEDLIAKTKAVLSVPFNVRGHEVAPSETLTVRNFRFSREEDAQELDTPVFHSGDTLWAKFDITGFKYGTGNKVDISYSISILDGTGKVLWTQPEPSTEQTESFYPKPYLPAVFSIMIQKNTRPGDYAIMARVTDASGKQNHEAKAAFQVE